MLASHAIVVCLRDSFIWHLATIQAIEIKRLPDTATKDRP